MLCIERLLCMCFTALALAANVAAQTITTTTTVTRRTRTTTSTTSYVTLTNTVTSYHYSYETKIVRYTSGAPARPVIRRGYPEIQQQKEQRELQRTTTTLTDTQYKTKTFTYLEVQGVYTYTTEHPDSTLTLKVTSCAGVNPTPAFHLQVVDSTPTRTDEFNSAYVTPTTYKNVGKPFRALDFVPSKSSAALFNIDCIGRLVVYEEGFRNPLFANVDYFQPGFEPVYFQPQKAIEQRQYLYVYCDIGAKGYLRCDTPQPPPTKNLTMFQTCPIYDEYFENPLIFANYQSPESPDCFGFRFKTIPANAEAGVAK